MSVFTPDVVDAVLRHMNDDHLDDNVIIVRAFAGRDADTARMSDIDGRGGTWRYTVAGDTDEQELHVPWPTEITARPEVRLGIVAMYDAACAQLGLEPRPH